MIKLLPLLLIGLGLAAWMIFSAIASGRGLRKNSVALHNDQAEAILLRLGRVAGVEKPQIRILEQPMVNAMVAPTGEIYVSRGLFRAFQAGRITGPEFASVIAHELGHLALGHTRRRMVDVAGAQTAQILLGGILSRFIPFIGWWIAQWLATLFIARLSRADEFEADAYATALMLKSGFGADPQVAMLEKILQLNPGSAQMAQSWLASHPPVPERIAAIRANAARWTQGRLEARGG